MIAKLFPNLTHSILFSPIKPKSACEGEPFALPVSRNNEDKRVEREKRMRQQKTTRGGSHLWNRTFFTALRKQTVTLRLDAIGRIANSLASALSREAVHIVAEGIADVEAVDAALVHGPGLRWSIAGSHMNYHLGGGSGGLARYLEQLGPSQERRWETLGNPPTVFAPGSLRESTNRQTVVQ
jgi:3-hydroxyacyl-CoA dehydrogenase, C-terminal domain